MSEAATLARFVHLRSRFVRSVHVERDFLTTSISEYLLTESGASAFQVIEEAIEHPAQRALSISGPYGAGKSAFCVHLARTASEAGLAGMRLHPVLVVGSRRPLAAALVEGLQASLVAQGQRWQELPSSQNPRLVADLFAEATATVRASGLADGLLLIVDEMGKFLEYAALHPAQGDIFALQEIAEAAARSPRENPLVVLTVQHQSAEAYARSLGPTQQAEWAKVGERFRAVPFFPSDRERLDVIGQALSQDVKLGPLFGLEELASACVAQSLTPTGMAEGFPALAQASYPLHPVALLALPALFRRAGQSHRSVFNFLAGQEAHALGRFLQETPFHPTQLPLYRLDRLYDYATEALAGVWSGASAPLWAEVSEAIERAEGLSSSALSALKCIGLLGLLKAPRLSATFSTLELALAKSLDEPEELKAALEELVQRRLVVYSRARQMYRLWEGGDVDIEAEMERAASGLSRDVSLHAARDLCPPPVLMARRHSFETGTRRNVTTEPCAGMSLAGLLGSGFGSLRLALCLAQTEEEAEVARVAAEAYAGPETLIAVALESEALRQAGRDVAAAAQVEKDTPELSHDRASRRELAGRRHEAETAFRAEWMRLFSPGPVGAQWYWRGTGCEIIGQRAFSEQLSTMADATYSSSPRLRNELINRPLLSSAAAAGRRSLIEAMLLHGDEARLGIVGFPPELSMYECLLRATGLHHQTDAGQWEFGLLPDSASELGDVWEAFSKSLFTPLPMPRSVREVWDVLQAPPYGLTEGVLPVLLCAFLLAHESETTLYREGTFLAEPGVADWELLLRRPEMFAVAGCRVTGARAQIVTRLGRGLGVKAPAVVPVVRSLIKMVRGLPEHSWKTRRLPSPLPLVREAFEKARSPERLLFVDLPAALSVPLLEEERATESAIEAFFIALNGALKAWSEVYPRLLVQAKSDLLASCSLPSSDAGWARLRERCVLLRGRVAHPLLLPFITRATGDDPAAALESVLAFLGDRPPRNWTDGDYERFLSQSRAVGELLRQADAPEILLPSSQLSPEEVDRSRQMAEKIKMQHGGNGRLLRAALLTLLQQLNSSDKENSPDE
jgi:hypothetical protein